MLQSKISFRVRYAEVDSMKYVYYGNYAQYFELGRVELLREIGLPYSLIEDKGIWLPVSEYSTKYIKSARYDDLIHIHTFVREKPGVRIAFDYEIYNETGELLTTARTVLYFFDPFRNKIIRCPDFIEEVINAHWVEG